MRGNPVNWIDPSGLLPPDYTRLLIETTPCGNSGKGPCGVHPVIRFIIHRIHEDAASQEIENIRVLNETRYYEAALEAYEQMTWWQRALLHREKGFFRDAANLDAIARSAALAQFGCLVADGRSRPLCGQWDYKVEIGRLPPTGWGQAQRIDFCSIGREEEVIFYYDIWANIHFGYLGMTGGGSEDTLLTGADIEQTVSVPGQIRDDSSDKVSVKIGIDLYKGGLTEQILLRKVYEHKDRLNKARVEDGIIKEIYQ